MLGAALPLLKRKKKNSHNFGQNELSLVWWVTVSVSSVDNSSGKNIPRTAFWKM